MRVTRSSWFDVSFSDGWLAASYHPGLLVWHWVGLVCQPNWWLLTMWTWCLTPQPSSILLLMTATCRRGWLCLGQSLQLLSGQICHLKPSLLLLAPAMYEVVVVSLSHLWWKSPVFLNNTESWNNQVLVSLPETGMMNMMGYFQMPLYLQGHFGHLVVWGCGSQSGYWFQASDHLGHSIWQPLTWKQWLWIETLDKFIQFGHKGPCKKIKKLLGLC